MQRNKYIYCLADAALVVHSGTKGGTWNGATENLRNRWVPLWVKRTADAVAGNHALAQQGGSLIAESAGDITVGELFIDDANESLAANAQTAEVANATVTDQSPVEEQREIGAQPRTFPPEDTQQTEKPNSASGFSNELPNKLESEALESQHDADHGSPGTSSESHSRTSYVDHAFYDLFLEKLAQTCSGSEKTPEELAALFDLRKTQVNAWLKRALDENRLRKHFKPVRYKWNSAQQTSFSEAHQTFRLSSDPERQLPKSQRGG